MSTIAPVLYDYIRQYYPASTIAVLSELLATMSTVVETDKECTMYYSMDLVYNNYKTWCIMGHITCTYHLVLV